MGDYINDLLSFNFKGRLNRAKYWKYVLFGVILSIPIAIILNILNLEGSLIGKIIDLVFAILCFPFAVRRLHDLNKSGWFYLLFLIPIVNIFFFIYFGFFKGTTGSNKYGPDPLR